MEKGSQLTNESRQLLVKQSFKQGFSSILTACSKQDFSKAFERFSKSEQEALHRVFVQMISCLHANTLEEFETLFVETQAADAFESVEQVLEEQSVDPLFSDKTNVEDVWQDMATLKEKEIQHLKNVLQTLRSGTENEGTSNGSGLGDNVPYC